MTKVERRLREQQELKQRILDTAREIARDEGWSNVSLRKIADRIEYSHAALYVYFESKEALFVAVLREGFRLLLQDLQVAKSTSHTPEQALLNVALAYWRFAWRSPELYKVMYGLDGVPFGVIETRVEGQQIGDVVAEAVQACLEYYHKPDAIVQEKVSLLWSTIHGLIALAMAGRLLEDTKQQEALVKKMVHNALLAWLHEDENVSTEHRSRSSGA